MTVSDKGTAGDFLTEGRELFVAAGLLAIERAKPTIGEIAVIREILDHAATVDEAIEIFNRFNIDMGSVPIHYLVTSAAGDSAVVECSGRTMATVLDGNLIYEKLNEIIHSVAVYGPKRRRHTQQPTKRQFR